MDTTWTWYSHDKQNTADTVNVFVYYVYADRYYTIYDRNNK